VTCPTATTCVALGTYTDKAGNYAALAATETAGTFARAVEIALPANAETSGQNAYLGGRACPNPTTCVAVGSYFDTSGDAQSMAATWTKGTFARAVELTLPSNAYSSPTLSGAWDTGIACPSATTCLAIGQYDDKAGQGLVMSSTWTKGAFAPAVEIEQPANTSVASESGRVQSIACPTATTCIAVGSYAAGQKSVANQAMTATWTNGTFARAVEPKAPSNAASQPYAVLTEIACPSATTCIAVGAYLPTGLTEPVGWQVTVTGGAFTASQAITPPDSAGRLFGIGCTTSATCVAVGSTFNTKVQATWVTTESGGTFPTGKKVAPPSGSGIEYSAVTCPTSTSCLMVGWYVDSSGDVEGMADFLPI
jgi:hypothetical protein